MDAKRGYVPEDDKNFSHEANVLDSYVMNGGLSGAYVYSEKEDQASYIKDVYTTINGQ